MKTFLDNDRATTWTIYVIVACLGIGIIMWTCIGISVDAISDAQLVVDSSMDPGAITTFNRVLEIYDYIPAIMLISVGLIYGIIRSVKSSGGL